MADVVSVDRDGADAARTAFERCVTSGGVALFPADGLYGLAADPLNEAAVGRIHEIKGRDEGKPSAVMYFSVGGMRELLDGAGPRTRRAMGELLPGPVTLVIANPARRYRQASRDDPTRLGVRLIEGPLDGAACPVLQTSANPSGAPAPHRFEDLAPPILEGVDLAIDGGELTGSPSTVIDISELDEDGSWEILREGGLSGGRVRVALEG